MNKNKKSFAELNGAVMSAQCRVNTHTPTSDYSLVAAKEELRTAKEALRVFKYKAHQSVSRNGRSIRF